MSKYICADKLISIQKDIGRLVNKYEKLRKLYAKVRCRHVNLIKRFNTKSQKTNSVYLERNILAALLAHKYPSGLGTTRSHRNSKYDNLVYIDLPSGQISFHFKEELMHLFSDLPLYDKEYDGHTKADVIERIQCLLLPASKNKLQLQQ